MMTTHTLTLNDVTDRIRTLPGRPPFMLTSDLAEIYETTTKRINEAVRRNTERFPEDFCFTLTAKDVAQWSPQNAATKGRGGNRKGVRAFTHAGCNMLAAVLKSTVAAERSVMIIRAFTAPGHIEVLVEACAEVGVLMETAGGDVVKLRFPADDARRLVKLLTLAAYDTEAVCAAENEGVA